MGVMVLDMVVVVVLKSAAVTHTDSKTVKTDLGGDIVNCDNEDGLVGLEERLSVRISWSSGADMAESCTPSACQSKQICLHFFRYSRVSIEV
jgi:hypothetical protein